jgi:hypothetical protein
LGFRRCVLDTKTKLVASNTFYEKLGFVDCADYNGNARADRWMAVTLDDAFMARLLSQPSPAAAK